MKILMAFALLLIASLQMTQAKTIHIDGKISEFTCSAQDYKNGCAQLHQLQRQHHGKHKTAQDIQKLVAAHHNTLCHVSLQSLKQGQLMVFVADYI